MDIMEAISITPTTSCAKTDKGKKSQAASSKVKKNVSIEKVDKHMMDKHQPGTGTESLKSSTSKPNTVRPPLPSEPPPTPPPLPPVPLPAPEGKIPLKSHHERRLDKLEEILFMQCNDSREFQDIIMSSLGIERQPYYEGEDEEFEQFAPNPGHPGRQEHVMSEEEEEGHDAAILPADGSLPLVQITDGPFASRFVVSMDAGKPVSDIVADNLNIMLTEKLDEKILADMMENYDTPTNVKLLKVPLVNESIWGSISTKSRSVDLKIQRVQKFLIKGLIAMTRDMLEVKNSQEDALACLTSANFEMNMLRRELLKPELKLQNICKPSVKVTSWLFGDDLGNQIKDITESQKATVQVVKTNIPSYRGKRLNPYNNQRRGGYRYKQPFLGLALPTQTYSARPRGRGRGGFRGQRPYQVRQQVPVQGQQVQSQQ